MSGMEMGNLFDHRKILEQAKQAAIHVELNLDDTPNLEERGTDEETSSSESECSDDDGSDNDSILTDDDVQIEEEQEDLEVETTIRGRRPSALEEPGLYLINQSIHTISNLVRRSSTDYGVLKRLLLCSEVFKGVWRVFRVCDFIWRFLPKCFRN